MLKKFKEVKEIRDTEYASHKLSQEEWIRKLEELDRRKEAEREKIERILRENN